MKSFKCGDMTGNMWLCNLRGLFCVDYGARTKLPAHKGFKTLAVLTNKKDFFPILICLLYFALLNADSNTINWNNWNLECWVLNDMAVTVMCSSWGESSECRLKWFHRRWCLWLDRTLTVGWSGGSGSGGAAGRTTQSRAGLSLGLIHCNTPNVEVSSGKMLNIRTPPTPVNAS